MHPILWTAECVIFHGENYEHVRHLGNENENGIELNAVGLCVHHCVSGLEQS